MIHEKNTDAVWSEAISVYDYDYTSCAYTQSTKLLHSVAILNQVKQNWRVSFTACTFYTTWGQEA